YSRFLFRFSRWGGCRCFWRGRFRFFARGGFFGGRARSGGRFFLGRLLVGLASIISDVKTGAFENNTRASAEEAFYFAMAPFREPAKVLGTFPERLVSH